LTKINDYKRTATEETDGRAKCAEFPERKSRRKLAQCDTSGAIFQPQNFAGLGLRKSSVA